MQNSKRKFNILNIVTAVSFIYIAFSPYIVSLLNLMVPIFQGVMFKFVIESFFNVVFNFQNVLCFVASILALICVFTKFDKIGAAVSSDMHPKS